MKDSNFVTKTIAVVGVVAVMIYFAVNIAGYLINPLTTTTAYLYRSDDAVTVSGYVVREEQVLPDSEGLLYITRAEGEKVARGKGVATVYHDQETLAMAQELEQKELELEQLEYAQSVASGSQEVLKLDESLIQGIFSLKGEVAREDLTAAGQESSTLRTLVLKRDFTYQGKDNVEEEIKALQQEIRSLTSATRQGSTTITAPVSGTYSAVVDGYEAVLTPDVLDTLTPQSLRALQADSTLSSNVGKLILGNTWYYAAAVSSDALADLAEGDEVSLRFASGLEKDIPMTVSSIGQAENGEAVVVLSTDRYLTITTLLRRQNAQLISRSYTGIRIPKEALRVVTETYVDEEGREQEQRMTGVYCVLGLTARFKPVEVVYQGEDYYLVEADPSVMEGLSEDQLELRTLRSGDEVIVTARDVYDGKVIGS